MTKDELAEKIRDLPDDATIDDAIERLEVIRLIQVGIKAANDGKVITQDEVERRVTGDDVEILLVRHGSRRLGEIPGL